MVEIYTRNVGGNKEFKIVTDCENEEDFLSDIAEVFETLIEIGKYDGEWGFHLQFLLPQIVEMCCKYRGHESRARLTTTRWINVSKEGQHE